jgi:hypothetical protein
LIRCTAHTCTIQRGLSPGVQVPLILAHRRTTTCTLANTRLSRGKMGCNQFRAKARIRLPSKNARHISLGNRASYTRRWSTEHRSLTDVRRSRPESQSHASYVRKVACHVSPTAFLLSAIHYHPDHNIPLILYLPQSPSCLLHLLQASTSLCRPSLPKRVLLLTMQSRRRSISKHSLSTLCSS